MKTLTSFSKPIDAHLLVARLGGSGLRAYLRDEITITNDWFRSNALGGVRVEVADEDYERAVEIFAVPPTDSDQANHFPLPTPGAAD